MLPLHRVVVCRPIPACIACAHASHPAASSANAHPGRLSSAKNERGGLKLAVTAFSVSLVACGGGGAPTEPVVPPEPPPPTGVELTVELESIGFPAEGAGMAWARVLVDESLPGLVKERDFYGLAFIVPPGEHTLTVTTHSAACQLLGENPRTISVTEAHRMTLSLSCYCPNDFGNRIFFERLSLPPPFTQMELGLYSAAPDGTDRLLHWVSWRSPGGSGWHPGRLGPLRISAPPGGAFAVYVHKLRDTCGTPLPGHEGVEIPPASWSLDGRMLVTGDRTGLRIHEAPDWFPGRRLENLKPLAIGVGWAWIPKVSPDGSAVAYEASSPPTLEIVPSDGSGPSITVGEVPVVVSWSPDGSQIVFGENASYQLVATSPAGGSRTVLVENCVWCEPTWSPDGQWIAFTGRVDGGDFDVHLVSANGATLRRLTNDADVEDRPHWSADSHEVAFTVFGPDCQVPGAALLTPCSKRIDVVTVTGARRELPVAGWLLAWTH